MARIRVVPPYDSRGVYALTAAAGMLLGPAGGWLVLRGPAIPHVPEWIPEIATVLGAPAAFIAGLLSRCQRPRPVVLTGALFGFVYWLSFIITQDLAQSTSAGAQMLAGAWVGFLLAAIVVAVLSGLLALLLRYLVRFFLVTFIEQTGRLCPRCAYTIDPLTQPICPECGSPAVQPPRRRRWARAGRPLLIASLLLFLATAGLIIFRRGFPIYRFQTALDTLGEAPAGFITRPPSTIGPHQSPYRVAAGAWIPFPGNAVNGVIAAYLPADEPDLPAMQVYTAARPALRTYSTAYPAVTCSLDRAQADHVIRNGFPPELLKAIEAAIPTTRQGLTIDPAPFFSN